MIQRIQTVFLLLVFLLSCALFFMPVYSRQSAGETGIILQPVMVSSNAAYLVLNVLVGLFAFITIFLFKKRNLQVRLCNLNLLIGCIFTGTIFYFADHSKTDPGSLVLYNVGCYFPLVQLLLNFLAMRAIKKDEALVRSADRLR